jgi:hypothetical protein
MRSTVYMGLYLPKVIRLCTFVIVVIRSYRITLDLFEARAILLGRLGRHDQALELYAYRLQDYLKAEE